MSNANMAYSHAATSPRTTYNVTMAAPKRQPLACSVLLFTCFLNLLSLHTNAFSVSPPLPFLQRIQQAHYHATCLFAKKKPKSNKKQAKTSGFGGKAIEPCPCGSGLGYMKCCGKLHTDSAEFAKGDPRTNCSSQIFCLCQTTSAYSIYQCCVYLNKSLNLTCLCVHDVD